MKIYGKKAKFRDIPIIKYDILLDCHMKQIKLKHIK